MTIKLLVNQKHKIDGLKLLRFVCEREAAVVFFDPQYRAVLDKMAYGNEGARQKGRAGLPQMSGRDIEEFSQEMSRVLRPSGHLFMWVDKFMLCEGTVHPLQFGMKIVDLITWKKPRLGMGYRTRRKCEYLLVMQKPPLRAKGVWTDHGIPDVWEEDARYSPPKAVQKFWENLHPHAKPVELQRRLILSTTKPGDLVVDPCAGGYSVMESCDGTDRDFLGGDLL